MTYWPNSSAQILKKLRQYRHNHNKVQHKWTCSWKNSVLFKIFIISKENLDSTRDPSYNLVTREGTNNSLHSHGAMEGDRRRGESTVGGAQVEAINGCHPLRVKTGPAKGDVRLLFGASLPGADSGAVGRCRIVGGVVAHHCRPSHQKCLPCFTSSLACFIILFYIASLIVYLTVDPHMRQWRPCQQGL